MLQNQKRPQLSRAGHIAWSGTTQASAQTRDIAKEQIISKAHAWWGAFQWSTENNPAGLYWYGRYLEQFPLREKYSQNVQGAVLEPVQQSGFYWLRMAAVRYSHLPSQQYLRQALGVLQTKANERKAPLSQLLSPADYYQLMFACEVLDGTIKDQQIISPGHLAKLFSEITFSDIIFERKELYSWQLTEQHNPISVFFLVTAYLTKDAYFWLTQTSLFWEFLKSKDYLGSRAYSTNYLRKVQVYLYYLITDHLINESARAYYLEQLKKHEPRGIVAAQLAPPLKKAVDAVIRYHSIPLARQLKRELLPRLKMHCNFKEKVALDSEQPMKNHAIEERRQAFCELLVEQLRVYLKEGRLFNVAIHEQENPCFIAAIMHNLFTEALDYFELQETSFAKEIHAVLQKIKDAADNSLLNQQPESHFSALGFKETLSQRLHSYATAAKVSNVVKLKILPAYAALSSEDDSSHQETTLLTKLVYGGAALVEVAHVALPGIAMISGIGIPAFLGTSALMQGLRHALKSVHHYTHVVEHALKESSLANMFVNLAHIHHLVHEAGLFPHEHRERRAKLIEEKVLVELDYLLSNASPIYREALAMLICHWDAVYRPITEELNEKSNVFLATLLVELFLRGLSFRILAERLSLCERKRPQSSEEFIEFVEETIWRYSYPTFSDDMPLTTKNSQTFSALSVIFPNHLNAALNGKTECIFISSQLRPPYSLFKPCELIRHGSVYEIQQLNQCARNKGLLGAPLFLTNARQSSMITRSLSPLRATYEKPKVLYEGFRLLAAKFNLQDLKNKCNDCKDHYYLLLKEQQLSLEEKESAEKFQAQLITLNTILTQTLMQFDDNSLSHIQFLQDSLSKVGFLNSNHLDQYAIELFVDKAHAFLILLNNKYKLQLDFIPHILLARENKTKLLSLVREHAVYFEGQGNIEENNLDTRKQPSISVSATVLPTYSIFAVNSSSDTASVVPRVMNNVLN